MAPGHRGSEIDPTTTFQQVERQVVSLTTLATNQTSANPDLRNSEDYQVAHEIAVGPDPYRFHENHIRSLLAYPGYPQSLLALYRDPAGRVLFDDVANARQAIEDATGALSPLDGLRGDDGDFAENRLHDALVVLARAFVNQYVHDRSIILRKELASRPKHARLVAA